MKSFRFTLLNSLVLIGLSFGVAGSAFAGQAPEASKGMLSALGSSLWYSITNPKETCASLGKIGLAGAGIGLGVGALYLAYCRLNSKNAKSEILDAKKETLKLDLASDHPSIPKKAYKFWNLKFGSASHIAENHHKYYWDLYDAFRNEGEPEQQFLLRAVSEINLENRELERRRAELDHCLESYNILPRINDYNIKTDNPVESLISSYLQRMGKKKLYELSSEQVKALNKEIEKLASLSLTSLICKNPWKNFNWHRFIANPHEADVIEQYWKIYQMMDHLDAIQFCISDRQKILNTTRRSVI